MIIISWALALLISVPLLMLAIECLLGAAPVIKKAYLPPPPFVVLVPAHDEADGIGAVLRAVRLQLRPCDRVLVVADNCSDDTAAIARSFGAEVVERIDANLRGKAYALAHGREVLRHAPSPIVIVLDADCLPARGALPRLASRAAACEGAVQGCYLLTSGTDATPLVRISVFAFLIKNRIRQNGLQRMGGGALLQGTGMAFPWAIFDAAPLETASLVEDLKLGLDLRLAGKPVVFDPCCVFTSGASAQGATEGQRTRWEHGSIATALRYAPKLALSGILGRPGLLLLAADLAVPPVSLLAVALIPLGIAQMALSLASGTYAPVVIVAGSVLTAAFSLVRAWMHHGRDILPASMIAQLPHYLKWKLPIYRRLGGDRQVQWVRTSRVP